VRLKFLRAIIALLLCVHAQTYAQTDTLFWFVAPEVTKGTAYDFDRPIIFRITTYAIPATVTIAQPAGGGMPVQTVTIPAYSTSSVDVTNWIDDIENKPPNTILNNGIRLSSTSPVTVYYEVVSAGCKCDPELFVLKGKNALGTNFYVPSQNIYQNYNDPQYIPTPYPRVDVVASENSTSVTITPTKNIVGHTAGIPFTITLNAGQTYCIQGLSRAAVDHLQGTIISANKPVAVTISDDMAHADICSDLLGDQIVPVPVLGTEYIAVKGQLTSASEEVFLTATTSGTTVSQDGTYVTTLAAGQTYNLAVTGASTYIQTSNPVYALQLTGIGCETGTALLPPVSCTGSTEVSFTRSTSESLYLNLLVPVAGRGTFLVNGVPGVITSAQFSAVPGTANKWYAASISLPSATYPANSAVRITNSSMLFHLGVLNGEDLTGSRFGYFSNYGGIDPNASTSTPIICKGNDIHLTVDSMFGATYHWSGPNGFTSNLRSPVIAGASTAASGTYTVTVTTANNCSGTGKVTVSVVGIINTEIEDTLCEGDMVILGADSIRTAGTYKHTFTSSGGCDSVVTLTVLILKQPVAEITLADKACTSDSLDLFLTHLPLPGNTYTWDVGDATTLKGAGDGPFVLTWKTPGKKYVHLTAKNKCGTADATDSIFVNANPEIEITDVIKGQVCGDDTVKFDATANGLLTYQWEPAEYFYVTSGSHAEAKLPLRTKVQVIVKDTAGCIGYATADVYNNPGCCNVTVATAFTPNNDGKNDQVRIITMAYNQTLFYFKIYNRYGQKLFETNDISTGWDGTFKGTPQDMGTYYYVLRYRCADGSVSMQKGDVTLLR